MTTTAPLVETSGAPAPPGGAAEWVRVPGGRLRAALFAPEGQARGSVVLSPGRTEPLDKYFEVVAELQARGFVVLVHDWRGQGMSDRLHPDRLRGHARGWRLFLSDFESLLDHFEARLPRPWIALGHSMGGALTALALAEGERRFAAAVLSAPMLGVRTGERAPATVRRVSGLMALAGRGGGLPLPATDPLNETFGKTVLTHDHARWARGQAQLAAAPDLRLGGPTWGWLRFALDLGRRIERPAVLERIEIPVTAVTAGDERLVLNSAIQAAIARLPRGRYVEVPGAWHEILMETDDKRAVFWTEFDRVADAVAPEASAAAE